MYDFHMHSNFSFDSKASMASMVEQGIKKGLKGLCFTDHIEFAPALPFEPWIFDVTRYQEEIARLAQKYGKQISIKMGAEIGYHPDYVDEANAFIKSAPFDFILSSLHDINDQDFHTKVFTRNKTSEEAFEQYFKAYYECAKSSVEFNCLSHFDFLKRYVSIYNGAQIFKDNFDIIKATFETLIKKGKGIEVNTSGFRYGLGHTLPTKDFLTLYKALGGEIITTGSDSHAPEYVAAEFDQTYALLRDVGFNYVTRFEKMKPHFIKL